MDKQSDVLINTGLRTSMEELQNYVRELGMKEAIDDYSFESPDLIKFSAGTRNLVLQEAPLHQFGTLVPILNPSVASEAIIQQAAQLVSGLGETECLQTRCNIRRLEGAEALPVFKTRRPSSRTPQLGPIQVSRKQMFNDIIQTGVQFAKIDRRPNHVLLQLWSQLEDN